MSSSSNSVSVMACSIRSAKRTLHQLSIIGVILPLIACSSESTEQSIIRSGFNCAAQSGQLGFYYSVDVLVGGDRMISCVVMDANFSHSNTVLARSSSAAAERGSCLIGYDFDSANGGFFEFSDEVDRKVVYHDVGSTYNNLTVIFPNSVCTTY